jgi:hypothetical protein
MTEFEAYDLSGKFLFVSKIFVNETKINRK